MHAAEYVIMEFQVQMYHHRKTNSGFTLIELLLVIAIIGVLATFVIVNVLNVKERVRDAQRKSDLSQIQSALFLYKTDMGTYPASIPLCGTALTNGNSVYLKSIPCDPLNSGQFVYSYTSTGATFSLVACLENINDPQKDSLNDKNYCTGGNTNWSYTKTNP